MPTKNDYISPRNAETDTLWHRTNIYVTQCLLPLGVCKLDVHNSHTQSRSTKIKGSLAGADPVFHLQGRHSRKLPHIVGDHDEPFAAGMGRYVQIVHSNRPTESSKPGANGTVVLCRLAAIREYVEPTAKVFDGR
jgi:hypothetical protein